MKTQLLIVAVVAVAVVLYLMNRDKKKAGAQAAAADRAALMPRPPEKDAVTIDPPRDRDSVHISEWDGSWELPIADNGCFHFTVTKESGLVIGLRAEASASMSDARGYGIVLNNAQESRPESWIGRLPYYHKPMTGTKVNKGFKLFPGMRIWVAVKRGEIWVGQGRVVGKNIITFAVDPSPESGVKWFGFGSFGKAIGNGKAGNRVNRGQVSDIQICQLPPDLPPLPSGLVKCPNAEMPVHLAAAHIEASQIP